MTAFGPLGKIFAGVAARSGDALEGTQQKTDLVSSIMKLATTDSISPQQRAEARVQEENRQAGVAREDAQRQQTQSEDDRRQAYFADPTAPKY